MKTSIQSVKGTREFYPEEMAVRQWLYGLIRGVSELFGYQEYDGPFLEKLELFAAKSGEELVKEQAFVFPDRGGELITLRPELTLSLARMVSQRQGELIFPLRWWSFGPFWRYEKPQKGRSREFFQWNADLIGVNSPQADAELIAMCAHFFIKAGLAPEQVLIYVNDRELMESEFIRLGIGSEQKKKVLRVIDRRDKMPPDAWDSHIREEGFTPEQIIGLKSILNDNKLWEKSEKLKAIFSLLKIQGLDNYVQYNADIVRGLDYYTGVVFEARDVDGGRSILGGGHYDNLVEDVGGEAMPGVGFAMGDVMAQVVMQKYGKIPNLVGGKQTVLVTIFDNDSINSSLKIATDLRQAGIRTICYHEPAKLQKQIKFADRIGAQFVLITGPDELADGLVTIKDLSSGVQESVERSNCIEYIRGKLAHGLVVC